MNQCNSFANTYNYSKNKPKESHMPAKEEFDDTVDPYERNSATGFTRSDWSHISNKNDRSILSDLAPYALLDDIKNKADVIYNKMKHQTRRGKIRNQMLFFCVYNAHLELGRNVNHAQLGKQFGLTTGEIQRCDSIFSFLQTGYRPPIQHTSPLGYLPNYCENIGLSQEAMNNVILLGKTILEKDAELNQENPQTVAAGILRYYLIINGIFCEMSKITEVTLRSAVTIDAMLRKVQCVDNGS